MCRLCVIQLVTFYEFKQKCEKTQKKFENQLSCIKNDLSSTSLFDLEIVEDQDDDTAAADDLIEERINEAVPSEVPQLNSSQQELSFKCDICRHKPYKLKSALESHLCARHNMAKNQRQCEYCDKWYAGHRYNSHIDQHKKPHKCDICSKYFATRKHVRRHRHDVHEHQKPFTCDICEKSFAQHGYLKLHMSRVHMNEHKFKCQFCGKAYKTKTQWKEHENMHLPAEQRQVKGSFVGEQRLVEGPFVCEHCGIVYTRYSSLLAHIGTHVADDQPLLPCNFCGKTFKTRSTLTAHRRIHNKKNKCDLCDMRFISSSKLKSHRIKHTGEKPYECEDCGMTFARKIVCAVHRRRFHTNEKPYKCGVCYEFFTDAIRLSVHRKKNHDQ